MQVLSSGVTLRRGLARAVMRWGPGGEAQISEVTLGPIDVIVDAFDHAPNKWMLKMNGRLVGYYDDLHDARSEANDRAGNND